jgi:hypothetical protein
MFGLDSADQAKLVLNQLRNAGFSADTRDATLRLSPGIQTTEDATREVVVELGRALTR